MGAFHLDVLRNRMQDTQHHLARGGLEDADDERVARLVTVRTEHTEGIPETPGGQGVEDVS